MPFKIPWFFASKYKGSPYRPIKGIKAIVFFSAEWDDSRIPAHFNPFSLKLFSYTITIGVTRKEGKDILLLKLPDNPYCCIIIRCRPNDCSKTRHGAINKLYT